VSRIAACHVAVKGDRPYTKHALDRMQPSGNRYGASTVQPDIPTADGAYTPAAGGRSVSPNYVEHVLTGAGTVQTPFQTADGVPRMSHRSGTLEVITEKDVVATIATHRQ
jgi:hypothetical protein